MSKTSFALTTFCCVIIFLLSAPVDAGTISLIDGDIGSGNGDFNYDGGGTVPTGIAFNENIPRDRYFAQTPNAGATIDIDDWTITRIAYAGGNNAYGLDGNFGFDNSAFEPANTGSGQAFTNGNSSTIVDFEADTISYSGMAGDVFCLSYLLGSDSSGATSDVMLILDAGLATEQMVSFATQTLSGTSRTGANDVAETYTSMGAYSTVDLKFTLSPTAGSTRSLMDDVRLLVTPVPEPTAAVLALLGVCALIRGRRSPSRF